MWKSSCDGSIAIEMPGRFLRISIRLPQAHIAGCPCGCFGGRRGNPRGVLPGRGAETCKMQWKHFALHLACAVRGAFAAMMHSTSTASARPHVSELAGRVIAEYREMPGLALSPPQACRLWGL